MKNIILKNKEKLKIENLETELNNLKVNTYKNIDISFDYMKKLIDENGL